ncbi:nucleotidyltransferase family protein [Streptomyces sp. CA-111067]|uniref:nucleotidyltransferase family protein n=1 Tax=Streptomyces sp. CA-111067 TaxID=3240046 RepID=UPI003D98659B
MDTTPSEIEEPDPPNEWVVLKALCRGVTTPAERDRVRDVFAGARPDLPRLVEHAMRHRMLPMLALVLADEDPRTPVPPQLRGELLGALLANRRKVHVLARAAAEATTALQAAGVRVAATKGVALETAVYGGLGARKMMDADLMIDPADRAAAAAVLRELGYRDGAYDWRAHRIDDLPPSRRAMYRLTRDHLPHFMRLEDTRGGVLVIDVATSVTWDLSSWQVPMTTVLAELDAFVPEGAGAAVPTLRPEWLFLFTVLHLYREAWFVNTVSAGKDMLYKFGDLLALWRAGADRLRTSVPPAVAENGLAEPVGWVLTHTDRLFGSAFVPELGLAGSVSEELLASGEAPGGRRVRWHGTMSERLLRSDPAATFGTASDPAATFGTASRAAVSSPAAPSGAA